MTTTLRSATACGTCGFQLGEPIASLAVSDLCFVSDHRFPGRCVVTLRQHATELFDLNQVTRHEFIDDVSAAARAIALAVNAVKINYEILGNADPHVHCHLIPRRKDEPMLRAPAWLHPEVQQELAAQVATDIRQRIVKLLDRAPRES